MRSRPAINPNWETYRKRLAIKVENRPEVLTSNWLRVTSLPDIIRYYYPPGPINLELMEQTCRRNTVPAEVYQRGFFSFASPEEVARDFADVAPFEIHSENDLFNLLDSGSQSPDIKTRDAHNLVSSMFRRAWENLCRSKGLFILPEIIFERCKPLARRSGLELTKGEFAKSQKEKKELPLFRNVIDQSAEEIFDDVPDFHRQVKARLLKLGRTSQLIRETTIAPNQFLNSAGYANRLPSYHRHRQQAHSQAVYRLSGQFEVETVNERIIVNPSWSRRVIPVDRWAGEARESSRESPGLMQIRPRQSDIPFRVDMGSAAEYAASLPKRGLPAPTVRGREGTRA